MLFARQRLLLTMLDAMGEPIGQTDFQKLLCLYTCEFEARPSYEFVPYRFGGFSFTSYADKRRLIDEGLLANDPECWKLTDAGRKAADWTGETRVKLERFRRQYEHLRGNALVAEVYRRFPYYAIRSEILEQVLPDAETRAAIAQARPAARAPGLITIGYEGKSMEAYLNQLIQAGVTLLCDVRRNPLSRKYGFSRKTLSHASEGVGIRYEHLPQLGIASERRYGLETQQEFDALFADYEREDLPGQADALAQIARWMTEEKQCVALTCFELLPQQCHRHCVAEALEQRLGLAFAPTHL